MNLIREVHEGGVTGDYVELQAYAAGQNFVAGKYINSYDAVADRRRSLTSDPEQRPEWC